MTPNKRTRLPQAIKGMKFSLAGLVLLALIPFFAAGQDQQDRGYIVKTGQMAPDDFTLRLTDGRTVTLKDLRGKLVLLQFTASWCSVCRQEIPHLEKEIWEPYKKGLVMIGVDRNESLDTVLRYHREMKVGYPFALDPGADIFGRFARKDAGVTRNVLIDPSGRIIFLTRLYDPHEFNGLKDKIASLEKN